MRTVNRPRALTPIATAAAIALTAAILALSGCGPTTPVPTDTTPSFQGTVADQTYLVGQAISILNLPAATGGDGELTYRLEPTVPGLAFDPAARTLAGTPTRADTYRMTYAAADSDDDTTDDDAAVLTFTITVQEADAPDTAPTFERTVDDQSYTQGQPIDVLTLPAATGGNGELSYTLQPTIPGLTFDPAARTLSGTPATVGPYSMTYRVVDADENTEDTDAAALSFTITVREPPPDFTGTWHFTGLPAPATVVFERDRFMVTVGDGSNAVGAAAPLDRITRVVVTGTLAAQDGTLAMTVDDDGVALTFAAGVSPAQEAALRQAVEALLRQADDVPLTVVVDADAITVTGGPFAVLLMTTELTGMRESAPRFVAMVDDRSFTIDVPVTMTLPSATGGNGTPTYRLEPEVPGLTFDETALTLSGTPTTPGAYVMSYRVVDDDTNTADTDADMLTFTITVREPDTAPAFAGTVDDQIYTAGAAIDTLSLPAATGGNGALTHTLDPPVPGLTFDAVALTLSGTPTEAGSYAMTYRVADADDNTADTDEAALPFTITVLLSCDGWNTADFFRAATAADVSACIDAGADVNARDDLGRTPLHWAVSANENPAITQALLDGGADVNAADDDGFTPLDRATDPDIVALLRAAGAECGEGRVFANGRCGPAVDTTEIAYRGHGDQVFHLNPAGEALQALHTLDLGGASAHVHVISTNTTTHDVSPRLELLDPAGAAGRRAHVDRALHRPDPARAESWRPWITEFNNEPPRWRGADAGSRLRLPPQRSVAVGDSDTFHDIDYDDNVIAIPATARKVVTDGSKTLTVWVADADWGAACAQTRCVRQVMVDELADRFLRPGSGNDIDDWVTAIFGEPWGPHDLPYLIPAERANQLHILVFDIDFDGDEGGVVGFFFGKDAWIRQPDSQGPPRASNERVMFSIDANWLATPDDTVWKATDFAPSIVFSTMAHEYQHVIHYYQKLIARDGRSETWLNEMSSEVAEDLIADKLMVPGPRGVAYDDPGAGDAENWRGRLPWYNQFNDLPVTVWQPSPSYSVVYALGAYLARTYGGAPLFQDIVQSDRAGVDAVEAALLARGHTVSFGEVLVNWAAATLLSDDTAAPSPYRYNSGAWSTSSAGGLTFRLGSINLYHYRLFYDSGPDDYLDGPKLYTIDEFNAEGPQALHSNRYVTLGTRTGTVRMNVTAAAGNRITVVVKEP